MPNAVRAQWLKRERMSNSRWKTFDVETADQDHVVFLFDVLYEKLKVFTRQYWLGWVAAVLAVLAVAAVLAAGAVRAAMTRAPPWRRAPP